MKNANTINVMYDGSCPFWIRIMSLVKRLGRGQNIHLTNIADRKFEARIYGKSQCELISELHIQLSDGTWLKGPDAFRELFLQTGIRPLMMLSRLPLIRQLFNAGYRPLVNAFLKTHRPTDRQQSSHTSVSTTFSSGSAIQH